MSEQTNEPEFCPPYSWPDADLVLQSQDGRKFRVHSVMMKMASGFFRGMLGIPRDPSVNPQEPLPMDETSDIVAGLLNIIYRISLPAHTSESIHLFGRILSAAEKYEMPSVIKALRTNVSAQLEAGHFDALSAFMFGCRYDWDDVAKSASSLILDINFITLDESPDDHIIKEIGLTGVMKLLRLQRARRDILYDMMNDRSSTCFVIKCCSKVSTAYHCCLGRINTPMWRHLGTCVFKAMDKSPSGDLVRRDECWDIKELEDLWKHHEEYTGCHCTVNSRHWTNWRQRLK